MTPGPRIPPADAPAGPTGRVATGPRRSPVTFRRPRCAETASVPGTARGRRP